MISGRFPAADLDCPRCGAREWEISRLAFSAGVRRWLNYGTPWRPERGVCRRCGMEVPGESVAVLVPGRPRWRDRPLRFVQVLRWARTAQPVPRLYLIVAVIGVALGIAARAMWGWPWWSVPASLLVLTWLVFLSTAFIGRMANPKRLKEDLIDAIDPRGAMERHQRSVERLFRDPPLPLYGVAGWQGLRTIGDHGEGPDGVESMSLRHGSAIDEEPNVSVTVSKPEHTPLRDGLADQRAERVDRLTIQVEGRPVAFQLAVSGEAWHAQTTNFAGVSIRLDGSGIDPRGLRLERVTDVESYIEGSRRELERWGRDGD